jgi:tRNA-splicing ligase RtcB (3'-phosphate/5'-hydroxy nucleic acid ligase)
LNKEDLVIFGEHEPDTIKQMHAIIDYEISPEHAVLCADGHLGYSVPVGGVIAYEGFINVNGVGFDIACIDGETEFLSPEGWVRMDQWDHEKVCEYDPETNLAKFVDAEYIKQTTNEDFYHLKSKHGINHVVSPDHRLLLYRGDKFKNYFVMSAKEYVEKHDKTLTGSSYKFNTSFSIDRPNGLAYTDEQLRLIVMTCADGYLIKRQSKKCVVSLKKPQKIERAERLLMEANMSFCKAITNNGYTNFRFTPVIWEKSLDVLWNASSEQLKVICEEVLYWDGNLKDRVFYTRDKGSADFIHYAFACCGYRSVMREDFRDKIDYRVFAQKNTKTGLKTNPLKGRKLPIERIKSKDGFKYCFKVPSGFFIVRREGNIIITGNCGNKAVRLDCNTDEVKSNIYRNMNEIQKHISFGVGRKNSEKVEHSIFDDNVWDELEILRNLKDKARDQLGTVGSGNHYVDIFTDELNRVWIGVHFGSRGLGHSIATYFIKQAGGKDGVHAEPVVLDENSDLGAQYLKCMELAGRYAYAGRDWVCSRVAQILRAGIIEECHNHHNFAWKERHFNKDLWVVRKGATPAFPGQRGFVGGSMGDISVILEGIESPESTQTLNSTIHGAGRLLGRNQAKGKRDRKTGKQLTEGLVKRDLHDAWIKQRGVEVRGGDLDESPYCYRRIEKVLEAHSGTIKILHTLLPIGVAMSPKNEYDPYKD